MYGYCVKKNEEEINMWVHFMRFIYRNRCYLLPNRTTEFPMHHIWMVARLVCRDLTALSRKINPRQCAHRETWKMYSIIIRANVEGCQRNGNVFYHCLQLGGAASSTSTSNANKKQTKPSQQQTSGCASMPIALGFCKLNEMNFSIIQFNVIEFHVSNRSLQIKRYPLICECTCVYYSYCAVAMLDYF